MTWGQMAAVLQLSDLRHHFRRPQRPLQGRLAASLAAAGLFGGKFWPLQGRLAASFAAAGLFGGKFWPLQGRYTHPSFNGAAAVEHALCYLQV